MAGSYPGIKKRTCFAPDPPEFYGAEGRNRTTDTRIFRLSDKDRN